MCEERRGVLAFFFEQMAIFFLVFLRDLKEAGWKGRHEREWIIPRAISLAFFWMWDGLVTALL